MHLYASVHMHTQEIKMLKKKYWILYLLANFLTVLLTDWTLEWTFEHFFLLYLHQLLLPVTVAYY